MIVAMIILGALCLIGIVGTVRIARVDGYRRVPERR